MILKSIILVACHGCVVGALQIGMQLPHHPRAHVNFRSVMKRSASSSPLFTTPSNTNGSAATSLALPDTSTIAPWAKTAAIFALGYSLGATVIRRESQKAVSTKFGFIHMSLAVLVVRDLWRSTPKWAKPRITKFARKVTGWFGLHSGAINTQEEEENEDMDDISNFANFATKLRVMIDVAKIKLDLDDEEDYTDTLDIADRSIKDAEKLNPKFDFNVQTSLLALLQLLSQVKSRRATARDQQYRFAGTSVPDEVLEGMDEMFELADLAYDEHLSGKPMKSVLQEMGYTLIKHDTNAVPGYLGHYVAISADPKDKTAIIGVKGTSNLEDFLTDMCGSAVEHNLTNPFYDGGGTNLRCHEGMVISSRRLTEDLMPLIENLLLPSGYNLKIVGHSLGAGCATLLAIFLRSSLPFLMENDHGNDERMRVWAFAPPPVLDLESAKGCSGFVTTVVNNCDIVPRANISPLVVTTRLLRAVNKKLKERNLDASDFQSTVAFLNKIREGKDGEMLMSADEVAATIDRSLDKEELMDSNHLYVPGKAIVMYDLWEKEVLINGTLAENTLPADEAVLSDGTCSVLRYIELDGRMFDDHMAPQYRSSIASILSQRKKDVVEK